MLLKFKKVLIQKVYISQSKLYEELNEVFFKVNLGNVCRLFSRFCKTISELPVDFVQLFGKL